MKVAALQNAESGQYSKELDTLAKIDRFGLEAIYGRKTFYYGELRCLMIAENIHYAYHTRKTSKDWSDWTAKNPTLAALLFEAEKLAQDE